MDHLETEVLEAGLRAVAASAEKFMLVFARRFWAGWSTDPEASARAPPGDRPAGTAETAAPCTCATRKRSRVDRTPVSTPSAQELTTTHYLVQPRACGSPRSGSHRDCRAGRRLLLPPPARRDAASPPLAVGRGCTPRARPTCPAANIREYTAGRFDPKPLAAKAPALEEPAQLRTPPSCRRRSGGAAGGPADHW